MRRIDSRDKTKRWQYGCPAEEHRHWRVVDGVFECRQCQELFHEIKDLRSGELVPRDEIEMVGPHASHKGKFGSPTVEK